jgi:transposase
MRFVGIDVSKERLDLMSLPDRTRWQVTNDAAGWEALCSTLRTRPPELIVLEATGRYEVGVVIALADAGMIPVVMNPLTIRRFRQRLGRRAKTDASDPDWQQRVDPLDSVPGIAPLSAMRLAVGLPELGRVSAKALASLTGIAPFPQDSGLFRGTRQIAAGRGAVRRTLYQVTMTTKRCDPTFRAHYTQLRERGKPHKVALVACMRRLLGILNAMVRDGLQWHETLVGQGHFVHSSP